MGMMIKKTPHHIEIITPIEVCGLRQERVAAPQQSK